MQFYCNYVYRVSYSQVPSDVPFHKHDVYELVYYTKGMGCVQSDRNQFSYKPGTIIIVPPNISHSETHYHPSEVLCIGFSTVDQYVFSEDPVYFNQDIAPDWYVALNEIDTENTTQQKMYKEKITFLLNSCLIDLYRKIDKDNVSFSFDDISLENLEKDDDIKSIWKQFVSAYSSYSYDRFRHVFKNRMGMSPNEFLIQLRIKKAKYMLSYTTQSIIEIAFACGYSSSSYFSQQFKHETGVTPSKFRRTR